jgi:hypothetical protein
MIMRWGVMAVASLTLGGCFSGMQPSLLTLRTINAPVMLSPVDRIGGGTPTPKQKVGDFDGESVSMQAHSEYSSGTMVTTVDETKVNNVQVIVEAARALAAAGPGALIQITKLRVWSRGWPAGVKNTVYIEGDVVRMGAGP